MCLASKYLIELSSIQKKMQSDISKLSQKESEYDKKLSEIYHKIETSKFNACEGYYLSKELQTILHKRRLIKHEGSRLRSAYQALTLSELGTKLSKVQRSVNKTLEGDQKYTQSFGITFKDIEDEIFH